MKRKVYEVNGRTIKNGETVTFDHSIQTFIVKVRSLGRVSPERIKDLIENKFEVVDIQEGDSISYVKGSSVRDFL